MFRRLRSNQRTVKAKEPEATQDTASTRVDPALTMGLDDEAEAQFSYPQAGETRLGSLLKAADSRGDDAPDDSETEADMTAAGDLEAGATESDDRTRLETTLPGEHRSKLARAAARLPKAVEGVVTVKRGEGRRMVVGRDICLSGEIKSCDSLAVEGRVEADLKDCTTLEVLPSGVVKGNATVQRCEIAGVFEGNITAEQYLLVRAGGRILGSVSYNEIEIERGGHISGHMTDLANDTPGFADSSEELSDTPDFDTELEEERARLKALQVSA